MTMTDENVWEYDTLEVNEDDEVVGSAFSFERRGGYDVVVSVSSYTYEYAGEFRMNHVPHIILQDETGRIVKDFNSHDSPNPLKAIENALSMGEYVYENYEDYIDN